MVKKMSKKNLDQKGRLRNKIISFRMSKEEAELLDRGVLMSGLTKQDFIVNSLLGKEIAVYGHMYSEAYKTNLFGSLTCMELKLITMQTMK